MVVFIECDYCGEEFERYQSLVNEDSPNYCSTDCFDEARRERVSVECPVCGDEHEVYPSQYEKGIRCCSSECGYKLLSERQKGEKNPQYDPNSGKTVQCEECGNDITRSPAQIDRREHNFCSEQCRNSWMSEKVEVECDNCGNDLHRQPHEIEKFDLQFCDMDCRNEYYKGWRTGEDHPTYKDKVEVECLNCGDVFKVNPGRSDAMYCDRECMGEHKTGADHHSWKGGYENYYGPNWNKQREKVLERDGRTCLGCGVHDTEYDREHDVHHIKPVREFVDEMEEVDWEKVNSTTNLVTLCRNCHQRFEKMSQEEQRERLGIEMLT